MEQENTIVTINLGNPEEISIKELAHEIIQLSHSKSKIIYKKLPQDDPLRRKPDITLAMEKLGWSPKNIRRKGLLKTINYFRELVQ